MKVSTATLIRASTITGIALALTMGECWSAEPTLVRLSFWVPPERMAEFEVAYERKMLPILKAT